MKRSEVAAALEASGLRPGGVAMMHGNAIAAAQITDVPRPEQLSCFFDEAMRVLGPEGTLVVPTFTYSFTKGESFDVGASPSTIGLFSEAFRTRPTARRSRHPIFSLSVEGAMAEAFTSTAIEDSFGHASAFELLHQLDATLICMACAFDRVTFVHYVEQQEGVEYRYIKEFTGEIHDGGDVVEATVKYFVRDLDLNFDLDLNGLMDRTLGEGTLRRTTFGRVEALAIGCGDFYSAAAGMLEEDPHALIRFADAPTVDGA